MMDLERDESEIDRVLELGNAPETTRLWTFAAMSFGTVMAIVLAMIAILACWEG